MGVSRGCRASICDVAGGGASCVWWLVCMCIELLFSTSILLSCACRGCFPPLFTPLFLLVSDHHRGWGFLECARGTARDSLPDKAERAGHQGRSVCVFFMCVGGTKTHVSHCGVSSAAGEVRSPLRVPCCGVRCAVVAASSVDGPTCRAKVATI